MKRFVVFVVWFMSLVAFGGCGVVMTHKNSQVLQQYGVGTPKEVMIEHLIPPVDGTKCRIVKVNSDTDNKDVEACSYILPSKESGFPDTRYVYFYKGKYIGYGKEFLDSWGKKRRQKSSGNELAKVNIQKPNEAGDSIIKEDKRGGTPNREGNAPVRKEKPLANSQTVVIKGENGHTKKRIEILEAEAAYKSGDYESALSDFQALAATGDRRAQYNLGVMYDKGQGVGRSDETAVRWYSLAANQGHPFAQSNLGIKYDKGKGVPQNSTTAYKWFRKAAEQGHVVAQHNLGFMYSNGRGVSRNDSEAIVWYEKAANQGYAESQSNLGFIYATARGVPRNFANAYKWFHLAASQGNAIAKRNMEFAKKKMSSGQIAEAKRLIENWNVSNGTRSVSEAVSNSNIAGYRVSDSIVAQNEKKSGGIQEQLEALVSRDNPNKNSISEAQNFLVILGFDPGPIDGVLGSKTRQALKEWKKSSGKNVSSTWLMPHSKLGSGFRYNNVRDIFQFVAEAILYLHIKEIEQQSGLGTMVISQNHPLTINFSKGGALDFGYIEIVYENIKVKFHLVGSFQDYKAVSYNGESKSPVWKKITDAKFYIESGSSISFSSNIKLSDSIGVICDSGSVTTVSSIRELMFSEKSKCALLLGDIGSPGSKIENYQYVDGDWVLEDASSF